MRKPPADKPSRTRADLVRMLVFGKGRATVMYDEPASAEAENIIGRVVKIYGTDEATSMMLREPAAASENL